MRKNAVRGIRANSVRGSKIIDKSEVHHEYEVVILKHVLGVMPSEERIKSGSLNKLRRRRKILLIAGWVTPNCSAARVTFFHVKRTSR